MWGDMEFLRSEMKDHRREMKDDMQTQRTDMENGFKELGSKVQALEVSVEGLREKSQLWTTLVKASLTTISLQSSAPSTAMHGVEQLP